MGKGNNVQPALRGSIKPNRPHYDKAGPAQGLGRDSSETRKINRRWGGVIVRGWGYENQGARGPGGENDPDLSDNNMAKSWGTL